MHISCKSCTKNEAFLAKHKKSCKNLARKICKIIFLQELDQILQENYLTTFSCKILARFLISCKKSFIFSARLSRYVQDLVQDLASLARKYLQDLHISCKKVFTGWPRLLVRLSGLVNTLKLFWDVSILELTVNQV